MTALRKTDLDAQLHDRPRLRALAPPVAAGRASNRLFRKLAGVLRREGAAGLGMRPGDTPAEPGRHHAAAGKARSSDSMLVRCAWCGCFRTGDTWTVVAQLPADGRVSHGICPRCFRAVGARR